MRAVLSFDGQNDYVRVERKPEHRVRRDITLEAWIFIQSNDTEYAGVVSKILDNSTEESGYGLALNGMGGVYFALRPASGDKYVYFPGVESADFASSAIPTGSWHHVAATYDGKDMVLYVDGQRKASQPLATDRIVCDPETDLLLGATVDQDEAFHFHGKLAEVRVWNLARTPAQISGDMNRRLQGNEHGLVYYAPVDEGAGASTHNRAVDEQGTPRRATGAIDGATWEKLDVPFEPAVPVGPGGTGGPGPEPKPAGSGIQSVIYTGNVLTAALERLNRQSVTGLLQQIVHQVDEHCRLFDGKVSGEVNKLRIELLAIIDALRKTSDKHQEEINNNNRLILDLQLVLNKLKNELEGDITTIVDNRLELLLPDIITNVNNSLGITIQQLVEQYINDVDIQGLQVKLDAINAKIELLKKAAEELDQGELKQIELLLIHLLKNIDLGSVVQNTRITIDGGSFGLAELLQVLATGDKILAVHFSYTTTDIAGARFVLTDGDQVQFVCRRVDRPESGRIEYVFETTSWKGLPASMTLVFSRKTTEMRMCAQTVALDTYDVVSASNIVFNLLPGGQRALLS